jgi:hypothetical protein
VGTRQRATNHLGKVASPLPATQWRALRPPAHEAHPQAPKKEKHQTKEHIQRVSAFYCHQTPPPTATSAKVQIDYRMRYAHTRSSQQASHGPLRDAQSIVVHSRSIDICAWAYGTIYGWQSIDLSQFLLLAGFAGTVSCTYYRKAKAGPNYAILTRTRPPKSGIRCRTLVGVS